MGRGRSDVAADELPTIVHAARSTASIPAGNGPNGDVSHTQSALTEHGSLIYRFALAKWHVSAKR